MAFFFCPPLFFFSFSNVQTFSISSHTPHNSPSILSTLYQFLPSECLSSKFKPPALNLNAFHCGQFMMLSGPTGHSNFLSPSYALVLVTLHSPGCHLVLFMPVFHLCDDFLHLFSVSMAHPSVCCPRAAPMNRCSLADLMEPVARPRSSLQAPQVEGLLCEVPCLPRKTSKCCPLWSL